jgi:hypothetical protein
MAFGVKDSTEDEGYDVPVPERFDYGDKDLELVMDETIKNSFFTEETDFQYRSDKLLIGTYADSGKFFWLDVREAFRMILVAPTRSGKSFGVQRIIGEAYLSGYDVAMLPDAKNEFRTMDDPVQEKFRAKDNGSADNKAFIHPEQDPQGIRCQSYRPTFFEEVDNGRLPEDNKYCSVNLADIEKSDFRTLLGFSDMTSTQKDEAEAIYYDIEDGEVESIGDIMEQVSVSEMSSGTKKVLKRKFKNLQRANFFRDEYTVDPVKEMKQGKVPILNMQKFDSFSREGTGMPQVMLSIWLRNIINARRDGEIEETIIVNDETPRWIPRSGNPSCKKEFLESVDLDTGEGINYIFATQSSNKVPGNLISQCRYILFPWSLDTEDIKNLIRTAGIAKNAQTAYSTASRIKQKMDKYEWTIVDTMSSSYHRITFMAPIFKHKETDH